MQVQSSGTDQEPFERESDQEADPSPETLVARWERAAWLRAHVAALPEDQRRTVELRYWQELPWDQVGAALNRSEDAAKQLMRRALKALAARVNGEQEDG